MKMVVAIVHTDSSDNISQRLADKGFGNTCLQSQGSFLQQENRTLLIGVSDEKVPEVISIIRASTHWHDVDAPAKHGGNSIFPTFGTNKITVSGATIFVLDVDQFLRV